MHIGGFDVHRVMVDGGSGVKIMYLNLFKGLGLKEEDLESYRAPLMGFDRKMVIPKGRIKLLVQVEQEEVMVDFIVMDMYSPYTAILARSWLHALRAVSSTLHQKVKFLIEGRIGELRVCQASVRQCLIAAINNQTPPKGVNEAPPKL